MDRGSVLRDDAVRADLKSGENDRLSYALAVLASTRGGPPTAPGDEAALAEVLPVLRGLANVPEDTHGSTGSEKPIAHEALQALSAMLPSPREGSPAEAERVRTVEWLVELATDPAQEAQVRAIAIETLASQPEGVATLERILESDGELVHLRMLAAHSLDPSSDAQAVVEAIFAGRKPPPVAARIVPVGFRRDLSGGVNWDRTPEWAHSYSHLVMAPSAETPSTEAEWLRVTVAKGFILDHVRRDPFEVPSHYFWSGREGSRATAMTAGEAAFRICIDNAPSACVRHDGIEPRVRAGRCDDPRCEDLGHGGYAQGAMRRLHAEQQLHLGACGRGNPESVVVRQ